MEEQARVDRIQAVANRLSALDSVKAEAGRNGVSPLEEAWQIAIGLSDIEESVARVFGLLVPRLLDESCRDDQAEDALHDIGEEYRHILYHIRDTRYFSYVEEA